ncbi:MAG: serine hydrolase [Comamonadaceae bacterium]|nr:MAG: serine hydrolase [Comamonadaceae bacterium]
MPLTPPLPALPRFWRRAFTALISSCGLLWAQGPAHSQEPLHPVDAAAPVQPATQAPWARTMHRELERFARQENARFGVYVHDLDSGQRMSFHGDERWYLASSVKVPVAIAVLRAVERGDFSLETALTLRAGDYVDGAGSTSRQPVGTALTVRWLLEQMIIYSDNTASDMLIGLVGIREVNAVTQLLVPRGLERITSLADVRRHAYRQLTPEADHLSGSDFLVLKQQRSDADVKAALARLLHLPASALQPMSLSQAYEAYYAEGLNSGRLDAYADLLAQLVGGAALNAQHTAYLLGVMERVKTGPRRIKAGLPPGARFAHKTGTQRARTCDSGLVTMPRAVQERRVIVVACTRGEPSTARSDRTLRHVGIALCQSGLLSHGKSHETTCPRVFPPSLGPVAPAVLGGPGTAGSHTDDDLRDEP